MTYAKRTGRQIAESLAIALVFFLGAIACLIFARTGTRIAAVWLPNAIVVVWLAWRPGAARPLTYLSCWFGNALANILIGDPPFLAAGLAFANSFEIIFALYACRRANITFGNVVLLKHFKDFVWLCCLVAPSLSAAIAVTILTTGKWATDFSIWFAWALTDGLGMMLFGCTFGIVLQYLPKARALTRAERIEWAVMTAGGALTIVAIFAQSHYPLLFMITPVVVVHAFRHGLLGTAISTIKIAIIATIATAIGSGPIMLSHDPWMRCFVLQAFLLTVLAVGIPIAALLERQRAASRQLRESNERFVMLADSMGDGVLAFDHDGRCTFVAGASSALLGRSESDIIGHLSANFVGEADAPRFAMAIGHVAQLLVDRETVTFSGPERDCFVEALFAPPVADGREAKFAVLATLRDVTERVRLERELVEARERAEHAALAKSQFLANMSHEIRTPMNGVLGFAELLENEITEPEQRKHAAKIVRSGNSMMQLLNDILDLSKIEAGLITICEEEVELGELLAECIELNDALAMHKGLLLVLDIDDDVPSVISADALRLRQILLNLLGNAVKFTDKGEVRLQVACQEERLLIKVKDTGIGVPASRLGAIFKPFEQADNATSRRFGGTGLGLAISRELAEKMDGELKVESMEGKGSQFTLTLPLKNSASERYLRHKPSLGGAFDREQMVLLVEDHEINLELVKAILDRVGQSYAVAMNGYEAIDEVVRAARDGRPYRLVLMDVQMPLCDGYAATRAIRAAGFTPEELTIVAMTANAYPEDVRAALAAGMQDHFAKPIMTGRLLQILSRWLKKAPDTPEKPEADEPAKIRVSRMWAQARSDGVAAAQAFLTGQDRREEDISSLRNVMHRLAGTAAHFGEPALGEAASKIDRLIAEGAGMLPLKCAVQAFVETARELTDCAPSHSLSLSA